MKALDTNEIANLERAISQRWGNESIQNPKAFWNEDKEEIYKQQLKLLSEKEYKFEQESEKVEVNGILLPKKLVNRQNTKRNCSVCNVYSFDLKDDLYLSKFDCCYRCYIEWVEDREKRWQTGWRPNLEKQ